MKNKTSAKYFKKYSGTNKMNTRVRPMRGGTRL
jgi:hypothetical protein